MRANRTGLTLLILALLPTLAAGGDPAPSDKLIKYNPPKKLLVSKSDVLSNNLGLSSVTIQTAVKTVPADIPKSPIKSENLLVAE